jgi:hypothetical protein
MISATATRRLWRNPSWSATNARRSVAGYESFYLKRCRGCEKKLEQKYRKLKPKTDGDLTKVCEGPESRSDLPPCPG